MEGRQPPTIRVALHLHESKILGANTDTHKLERQVKRDFRDGWLATESAALLVAGHYLTKKRPNARMSGMQSLAFRPSG
jgi:hypothetical protein